MAFESAFPLFKDEKSWVTVADYLYGVGKWKEKLLPQATLAENDLDSEVNGEELADEPPPIQYSLQNYIVSEEDGDNGMHPILRQLKNFVFPDEENEAQEQQQTTAANNDQGKVLSEAEAKNEIRSWTPSQKKLALKILAEVVPEHLRKSASLQPKDLVSWLQSPNSARPLLFCSHKALKNMMDKRNIVLTGRSSIAKMINGLAGIANADGSPSTKEKEGTAKKPKDIDDLGPKLNTIKNILVKSFLPHQKGDKRQYCSWGHRLEMPILKNWSKVCGNILGEDIQVKAAFKAGLAAKMGAEYAKDSIDFVLIVEENGEKKCWGFEAKGRVTANTAANEEQDLHFAICPHIRVADFEVEEYVSELAERFQIMQHSFVYDFETVVLAISDRQSELIRSVTVDFSTELKNDFGKVLKDIKDLALKWVYENDDISLSNLTSTTSGRDRSTRQRRHFDPQIIEIPDEVAQLADIIPTINGIQTLQGSLNLWKEMNRMPKPIPSMRRIIPTIYAFWNSVKGGSDTTTKLMDDCLIQIPKSHMNCETVAISRCIMLMIVFIHRCSQILSAKADLDYPSLHHYRHAASKRLTYHRCLVRCGNIFSKMLLQFTQPPPPTPCVTPPRCQQTRRRQPLRQLIDGVRPEPIKFGPSLSTQTPERLQRLVINNEASMEIQSMVTACQGMPMQVYPAKSDKKCAWCGKNTSFYCMGCKRWFCMSRRATKHNSKELKLYTHKLRKKQVQFNKSCFHEAHEDAWCSLTSDGTFTTSVSP